MSKDPSPEPQATQREFELKAKEAELNLKARELELIAKEIELRRKELQFDLRQRDQVRWRSPLFLAAIALFGTAFTAVIGYLTSVSQEHSRAQSALVLEAIKTPDSQTAAKNLKFFTELGFLDDPNHKIRDYIAANEPPILPTPPRPLDLQSGLRVVDRAYQPLAGVQIEVSDGTQCPPTDIYGMSACPKALGKSVTLRKLGYETKGPLVYTPQQVFLDPVKH
jgi:hypothetical protein